jgi:hypothetical protein
MIYTSKTTFFTLLLRKKAICKNKENLKEVEVAFKENRYKSKN